MRLCCAAAGRWRVDCILCTHLPRIKSRTDVPPRLRIGSKSWEICGRTNARGCKLLRWQSSACVCEFKAGPRFIGRGIGHGWIEHQTTQASGANRVRGHGDGEYDSVEHVVFEAGPVGSSFIMSHDGDVRTCALKFLFVCNHELLHHLLIDQSRIYGCTFIPATSTSVWKDKHAVAFQCALCAFKFPSVTTEKRLEAHHCCKLCDPTF